MRFFAKTDVWNSRVPWTRLASRYENLLQEKRDVNSRIQSEEWAYRAALEKIEKREREKRQKEKELQVELELANRLVNNLSEGGCGKKG